MNEHLADFDRHADGAIEILVNLLNTPAGRANVKALARARFIQGFDQFPEGRIFTFGVNRLVEETLEEMADAVVYEARRQVLILERNQPSKRRGEASKEVDY